MIETAQEELRRRDGRGEKAHKGRRETVREKEGWRQGKREKVGIQKAQE